jgi:brefeldin A-inhibited guanine nucleotide-exchange protein
MKFSTPDNPEDQVLLRGKVLSLELLKMVVDNAGPFWRTNEKYDHRCSCFSYLHLTIQLVAFSVYANIVIGEIFVG